MKKLLQSILQRILGFEKYLFVFSWFKIQTLRWDRKEGDFNFFLKRLTPTDHVLDIGANIGIMTALLARRCRSGRIHAFEPVPENFTALKKIVGSLEANNVTLHQIALGEAPGKVEMVMPEMKGVKMQGLSHIRHETIEGFEGKNHAYEVPMKKLDDLDFWKEEPVHAIKLDVENYEQFVLQGAVEMLSRHKPLIYCELWDNDNRYRCFEILQGLGYEIFVLQDGRLEAFQKGIHTHQNFFFETQ